jgi:molecular chaperone DnaK (HSP70)
MIATKNPQIGKAVAVLMDLSADERTRMIEESREKARRDWISRMKGARQEGEQIGMEKANQQWQSKAQQWQSQAQQWLSEKADYQRQLEEAQRKLTQYEASGRNA